MARTFLDTNILVYCLDQHDPGKQLLCRDLLRSLQAGHQAVISTQVLQEFYVAATRKLGVAPLAAKQMVQGFRNLETVVVGPALVEEGIDCSILHQLSFWDGLVLASAASAGCEVLLTEDLNSGQVIRGVRIQNPFAL